MIRIAVVALVLVAAFLVYVQTRPDRFHVERSATIAAPSGAIVPEIADFHRWPAWSPFEKDPAMQRSYDGPPSGPGAGYHWKGNKDVGEGTARILESTPGRVRVALEFERPFKASNTATFTLAHDDGGTRVTWALDGPSTFVTKLIGTFMSMDTMVGGEFEKGLASLRRVVEHAPAAAS